MALVKSCYRFFISQGCLLLCCTFTCFVFSSGEPPETNRDQYKRKDSLAQYINKLYELSDDNPQYYCYKTDSLLSSLWRTPKTLHEQTAYLDFILLHAYHLQQTGQIPASTRWYEQGLQYQREHRLNSYETIEFIYKPLGNNYVRLGDYDKAIAIQGTAIQQAKQNQQNNLLSSLYSNQAITYFWLQQYDSTQLICNKGLQYISSNPSVTGLLYNIKTEAFAEQGIPDSAKYFNKKALEFFRLPESAEAEAGWAVSTLVLSAKIAAAEKNYKDALKKINNAEAVINQSYPNSRQRDKAKICIEKGNLLLKLNLIDSSLTVYKKGVRYFQFAGFFFPDYTVSELYDGIAQCYAAKQHDSSLYYYRLAAENDYFASQLVTSSFNSLSSIAADRAMQHRAITAFVNKYKTTGGHGILQQLLWIVELGKARKLLNEIRRTSNWQQENIYSTSAGWFHELRYDYLLLAEATDPVRKKEIESRIRKKELELGLEEKRFNLLLQPPSFNTFFNKITDVLKNTTVISYAALEDSMLLLLVNEKEIQLKIIPSQQKQVDNLVQAYFTGNSTSFQNNPTAYFNAAADLYDQLLPVATKQKLVISADAWLHRLPFEALVMNEQTFLGEEKELGYVYTLLQYNQMNTAIRDPLPLTVYTFTNAHLNFPALPQSETEARFLQKQFVSTVKDAIVTSTSDLLESMKQPSILHFATHAVANDEFQQPYLVLQQPFYLGQLQYTTTASPLIVLTACETAAGNLQTNEGLMSIGRAFISKGVNGVVASRWKVDDAVAPGLVKTFYTSLQKVHSPAAALFEARKSYLAGTNLSQKNPLLWAGFVYIGVEQKVDIKTNNKLPLYWWVIGAFSLAGAVWVFRMQKQKSNR